MKGYLTVFLSLILTVTISLCLTLIEGARRNTMVLEAECVTDTGMNSILAEYHRELLNQYELFFIDTSYGTAQPSYENTAEHLQTFMNRNFSGDLKLLPIFSRDFLRMEAGEIKVLEVSAASDEGGAVLRRQIKEYMKEKTGIGYIEKILGWMEVVGSCGLNSGDTGKQEEEAWKALEAWEAKAEEEGLKIQEVNNPAAALKTYKKAGILNMVADAEKLSRNRVVLSEYFSSRTALKGTGMNPVWNYSDGPAELVLFHEYILDKTGRYGLPKESGVLAYQTEYILGGKDNDIDNLKHVVNTTLALREAANVLHILSDEQKMGVVKQLSEALAALTTFPQTAPVFQVTLIGAWAYLESLRDVKVLLEGGKIPLLKSKEEWYFGFESVGEFQGTVETEGEKEKGLSYGDYLRIFLLLQDKETTTGRLMDIMEMDIRRTPGNRFFRMDGCIDSIGAEIKISSGFGYDFTITRRYGYK